MKKYKCLNDVVCHLMDIQQCGAKLPDNMVTSQMEAYFQGIAYALEQILEFDMETEE